MSQGKIEGGQRRAQRRLLRSGARRGAQSVAADETSRDDGWMDGWMDAHGWVDKRGRCGESKTSRSDERQEAGDDRRPAEREKRRWPLETCGGFDVCNA